MALNEAGWFGRTEVELWASDVSPVALEKATRGVYRERSFRALPTPLRDKYFTSVEDGWRVDPGLQGRVHYRRANLLNPGDTALIESARYIFCRNVFIYFAPATVAQIVARFAERMQRPGYLFIGVSESLLRMSTAFQLEQVGGVFVYMRN
jgi:chemotaxis protein methyltransferase CheR